MKNTYQSGQMLVFARDGEGANSIALDFRKDQLVTGIQYEVTIHVGAVTRRMSALAATKQVMIMQMGTDKAFYDAVRRKNSIVFNIEKKNYGFNLDASVSDALNDLNDCSDSFQTGGKFLPMTVALKKSKVADMALQNDELSAEPETSPPSKKAPAQKTAVKAAPKTKTEPVTESDQGLQSDVEKLRAENKKLLQENQTTRQTLLEHKNSTAQAAEKVAKQEALQTELSRAKAENERLAQESRSKQEEIKAEIARLKAENEKLAQATRVDQDEIRAETERLKTEHDRLADESRTVRASAPARAEQRLPPQAEENSALKNLLVASNVVSPEAFKADTAPGTYRWTADEMYGSAQPLPWISGRSFGEMANSYVQQAASLCKGSFAQKTGRVRKAGRLNVIESDMTCLDGENDAAAAVLFVADDGKLSVITEEGTVDQLTTAMSDRDSIISAASGQQID